MLTPWTQALVRGTCALAAALSLNLSAAQPQEPQASRKDENRDRVQMARTEDIRECISLGAGLELEQIDVDRFDVTAEEMDELYYDMLCTPELPWYMELDWSYLLDGDGTVRALKPGYLDGQDFVRSRYERAVKAALEETVKPGMSELQIALAFHDYLAVRCAYDESLVRSTEYDVLVHGSAVCQGYAEAYMDLLTRAGVECIIVVSEEMNHCWNQVKIDGQWYHVDVTWDDPTPDRQGMVNHGVFLISDETMQTSEYGYHSWVSPNTCTDKGYETDRYWLDSVSPVLYADADTSYRIRIAETTYEILRRDEATGEETRLARVDFKYPDAFAKGGRRTHFYTAGLSMADGALYYTDVNGVRRLDLTTGEVTTVYTHDVSASRSVLVGSFLDGDTLHLTTMDTDQAVDTFAVPLP